MSKKSLNLVCILIVLSLGLFSGYVSNSSVSSWYHHLNKPEFNPPAYVFGPVWTILYILMGLALAKIWLLRHEHPELLILFCFQLVLNIFWSPLFFLNHQIGLALLDLACLWLLLIILLLLSLSKKQLVWLLLPYALWVSFALLLNYKIWELN
jgi:benzodiazapine receptor